jgi:hypothetical protein
VDFFGGVAGLVASRGLLPLGVGAVVMEGFANANIVGAAGRKSLEREHRAGGGIVPSVDAAFGAVVGPEAEYVQFVDDKGQWVPPDVMLACLIEQLQPQQRRAPDQPQPRLHGARRAPAAAWRSVAPASATSP